MKNKLELMGFELTKLKTHYTDENSEYTLLFTELLSICVHV